MAAPPEDAIWEAVAEEMGWGVTDCLSHKLSFNKRMDAKAKVDALAAHVKRLRAAGWHLYDSRERAAMDAEVLGASLAREEAARREDQEAHESALRSVQQELGAAALDLKARGAELAESRRQVGRQVAWCWAVQLHGSTMVLMGPLLALEGKNLSSC